MTRIGPEQPPTFELPELCDNSFDSKKLLTDQQTFLETLQVTREESCQYESEQVSNLAHVKEISDHSIKKFDRQARQI